MTIQEKLWALVSLAWMQNSTLLCRANVLGMADFYSRSSTLESAVQELWSILTDTYDGHPAVSCADLSSRWLLIWIDGKWVPEQAYNDPTNLAECLACGGHGKSGFTRPEKGRWAYVYGVCDECLRSETRYGP